MIAEWLIGFDTWPRLPVFLPAGLSTVTRRQSSVCSRTTGTLWVRIWKLFLHVFISRNGTSHPDFIDMITAHLFKYLCRPSMHFVCSSTEPHLLHWQWTRFNWLSSQAGWWWWGWWWLLSLNRDPSKKYVRKHMLGFASAGRPVVLKQNRIDLTNPGI